MEFLIVSGSQSNFLNILGKVESKTRIIFFKRSSDNDCEILKTLKYLTNNSINSNLNETNQIIFFENFGKKMLLITYENLENIFQDQNQKFINNYSSSDQDEIILLGDISSQDENLLKRNIEGKFTRI